MSRPIATGKLSVKGRAHCYAHAQGALKRTPTVPCADGEPDRFHVRTDSEPDHCYMWTANPIICDPKLPENILRKYPGIQNAHRVVLDYTINESEAVKFPTRWRAILTKRSHKYGWSKDFAGRG